MEDNLWGLGLELGLDEEEPELPIEKERDPAEQTFSTPKIPTDERSESEMLEEAEADKSNLEQIIEHELPKNAEHMHNQPEKQKENYNLTAELGAEEVKSESSQNANSVQLQQEKPEKASNLFAEALSEEDAEDLLFKAFDALNSEGIEKVETQEFVSYETKEDEDLSDFEYAEEQGEQNEKSSLWDEQMFKETINLYDPDEIEVLMANESNYCAILRNPRDQVKDAEWLSLCQELYPVQQERIISTIQDWILPKADVFNGPRIITARKSWTIQEILENPNVEKELIRVSSYLWKETLKQADGNEPASWIRSEWIMKMIQHGVNYFTVFMR